MKNRAFVKYKKTGEIVPGSLIITQGGYPKGGPYKEITTNLCCDITSSNSKALILSFTIGFPDIGDPNNVATWNTWFGLPSLGNPFTSVEINGLTAKLYGGSNITIQGYFFKGSFIVSIVDEANCIVTIGTDDQAFAYCDYLTIVDLPAVVNICCTSVFEGCGRLTIVNIPSCTSLGASVGGDSVFAFINNNNPVVLTIDASRATCNGGNPDGDIEGLVISNPGTIINYV